VCTDLGDADDLPDAGSEAGRDMFFFLRDEGGVAFPTQKCSTREKAGKKKKTVQGQYLEQSYGQAAERPIRIGIASLSSLACEKRSGERRRHASSVDRWSWRRRSVFDKKRKGLADSRQQRRERTV
jgi:hypothetical protein